MPSKIDVAAIEQYLAPELEMLAIVLNSLNLHKSLKVLDLLQSVFELEIKELRAREHMPRK